MKNAALTTSDLVYVYVYNKEETIEMFGSDHLEEFGVEISQDLIERFSKNLKEFHKIQEELRAVKKTRP